MFTAGWDIGINGGAVEVVRPFYASVFGAGIERTKDLRPDAPERALVLETLRLLPKAVMDQTAPLADEVGQALEAACSRITNNAQSLRRQVLGEWQDLLSYAPIHELDSAILETSANQHEQLRVQASRLDDALVDVREQYPALSLVRFYLSCMLEEKSPMILMEEGTRRATLGDPTIQMYSLWLMADQALLARSQKTFNAACTALSRVAGDPYSRVFDGVLATPESASLVASATVDDPLALYVTFAMNLSEAGLEALFGGASLASTKLCTKATTEVTRWKSRVETLARFEAVTELNLSLSEEERTGFSQLPVLSEADPLVLWATVDRAVQSSGAILRAMEQATDDERKKYQKKLRKARKDVEALQVKLDGALDSAESSANEELEQERRAVEGELMANAGPQRGCMFSVVMAVAVVLLYAGATSVMGKDNLPAGSQFIAAGLALVPVCISLVVFLVHSMKKSAAYAELARRAAESSAERERTRAELREKYGAQFEKARKTIAEAEAQMASFESAVADLSGNGAPAAKAA